MVNMIAFFFSKACEAKELCDNLVIAKHPKYEKYRNKYNVVHISFNDVPRNCNTYAQYISRIEERLFKDIKKET